VKRTSCGAPHYAVFSSLLPLPPPQVQTFSSAPSSETPQSSCSLSVRDKVSQPYQTTGKIMVFAFFKLNFFREETGRQETRNRMVASIPL